MTFSNRNIICFAGEDWWFHNPHSNLHLMKAWSAANRVLFVNSPGIRMPDFKGDRFAYKRVFKKLGSLLRFVRKAQPNIWVFTPFAIPMVPRFQKAIAAFNRTVLLLQVRALMLLLRLERPILWVTVLVAKDVALTLRGDGGKCLAYYCVDNTPLYPGVDRDYMQGLEDDLNRRADLVFFTNQALLEARAHFNPNTFYTGHGVDYEHFAQAATNSLPVPADIAAIRRPIAGYMGEIASLDIDLLRHLAVGNPDVSFVFIGDRYADMGQIESLQNVHFLGKKSYRSLPAYLQCFDVCCLYYRTESAFNNYRNPKKLLEYLATGKPVVSVSILEVRRFAEYVDIAETYEAYAALLRRALADDDAQRRQARMRFAERQTWDHVAADIAARIETVIAARAAA